MPSKPLKECNKIGCHILTRNGYCQEHEYILEEQRQRRNAYYNRIRDDKKEQRFYKSAAWKRVREQALVRDNYLCQMCKDDRVLYSAETVHHIKHLRNHWELRLKLSNLISLCNAHHNTIHKGKHEES